MWLLGAGLVMAVLAALAGFTDFLGERRVRAIRAAWLHMIGNVVVVLLLFTGWKGWELVYRHHVAVSDAHEGPD